MIVRPLAIDLFCGLGGWTDGLIAEGFDVIGFDIERHVYGDHAYPAQLVVQDVLTLHGAQFKDAALIVASPPCQAYSYMAMPWTIAKEKAAAIRADETGASLEDLNRLFNACFRIQREACEAAGRHIPLVVENVRGAIPWVGRSRWNYGSFHLWGDVPALMPPTLRKPTKVPGFRFDGSGRSFQSASVEITGLKSQGMNWSDREKRGQDFTRVAGAQAMEGIKGIGPNWKEVQAGKSPGHWTNPSELDDGRKNWGGSWFAIAHNTKSGVGNNPVSVRAGRHQSDDEGRKIGGDWFSDPQSTCRRHGSKSKGRKMASAMIAKIPEPLSRHIARTYFPKAVAAE